jgi:Molecular chaperone GrpE (heat shock protein)
MSIKQHENPVPPGEATKKDAKAASSPEAESVKEREEGLELAEIETEDKEDTGEEKNTDAESATRIAALEAEVASLRDELSSLNDKYLRKLADDVNFRKRMAREKEEGQRFAVSALLGDLVPVLDDFDRAIASAETAKDYAVLHDGVGLIKRQLGTVLESKYGLSRVSSVGAAFDPNLHEAVAVLQGGPEDGDEAIVAEEFLPCYKLHDRIIRTAKVRVRMPSPATQAAPASQAAPKAEASASSPVDGAGEPTGSPKPDTKAN